MSRLLALLGNLSQDSPKSLASLGGAPSSEVSGLALTGFGSRRGLRLVTSFEDNTRQDCRPDAPIATALLHNFF